MLHILYKKNYTFHWLKVHRFLSLDATSTSSHSIEFDTGKNVLQVTATSESIRADTKIWKSKVLCHLVMASSQQWAILMAATVAYSNQIGSFYPFTLTIDQWPTHSKSDIALLSGENVMLRLVHSIYCSFVTLQSFPVDYVKQIIYSLSASTHTHTA